MPSDPTSLGGPVVEQAALEEFGVAFAAFQQAKRLLWEATVACYDAAAKPDREFVDDELALLMNTHPATAERLVIDACRARDLPALMQQWAAGNLTDRHVNAAVAELHRCLVEHSGRLLVLDRVLDKCRRLAEEGKGWPTPGSLRRMIRAGALLVDPAGAAARKEHAYSDRGVHAYGLPDGQAALSIDAPAEQVAVMLEAIRAHAAASREPGDTRTREQREFDTAYALLTRTDGLGSTDDPDGGAGAAGSGVRFEVQVVVPIATAEGADTVLGELPGLGPILPATCRRLLARANTLRRICLDAPTGQVLAVDNPIPVHRDPEAIRTALAAMRTDPIVLPDLSTRSYRPTDRAVQFVRTRDRTCRFPGCTRPATRSDLDHRLPWPLGPTTPANLQALCRHHHRAKQSDLFTLTTAPDDTTPWTLTRTGQTFRSPPPTLTHTW